MRFNIKKEGKNIDKEKLYEDNIKLKEKINTMNKELIQIKHEIFKKEAEIAKANKMINDHINEGLNLNANIIDNNIICNNKGCISNFNNNINNNTGKLIEKSNINKLIYGIKNQYKDVKKQLNEKVEEIEKIKKTMKHTKLIEFKIENKTLNDEIKNLYEKNIKMSDKIKFYENMYNEFLVVLENAKKQNSLIDKLKEENENLNIELKNISGKINTQQLKQDLQKELEYFYINIYINIKIKIIINIYLFFCFYLI